MAEKKTMTNTSPALRDALSRLLPMNCGEPGCTACGNQETKTRWPSLSSFPPPCSVVRDAASADLELRALQACLSRPLNLKVQAKQGPEQGDAACGNPPKWRSYQDAVRDSGRASADRELWALLSCADCKAPYTSAVHLIKCRPPGGWGKFK